ncbi:MAG: hypothetical protein IT323_06790 [Anaerolineae bacterium]|nr:hypothetical protein [Anaerolineae bacterium]
MQNESGPRFMRRLLLRENTPPWGAGTALLFVAAYIGLWLASLLIVSMLTGEIEGRMPSPRTLALTMLAASLVAALGIVQWMRRRLGPDWFRALRLAQPSRRNTQIVIFLVGLGAAWALDLVGAVLRLKGGEIVPPLLAGLETPDIAAQLLAALVALIAAPLAEGLVFGALLYGGLARVFADNRVVIVVASLVYTMVALLLSPAPATWYGLIQPFSMALILFSVRAYYQSARAWTIARAGFGLFFIMAAIFL